MVKKRYLIVTSADHSGGSKSHKLGAKLFLEMGFEVQTVRLASLKDTLLSAITGKDLSMVSINYDYSIKDYVKMQINEFILTKKIGKLDTSVVDGLLPISLRYFEKLSIYGVVIRSSSKCFSWTSRPQKLNFFNQQVLKAKKLICASNTEADIWKERLGCLDTPVVQYLTPMQLPNKENTLDLGEKLPFLLPSVGNIGPRKGVDRFLSKLDRVGKKIKVRILGNGELSQKEFENIIVETQYLDVNLCHPVRLAVRIFPSYSECFSRAQFEAVISGDPTIIATAGSDPEINQFLPASSICASMDELVNNALNLLESYHTLDQRNSSDAKKFYKSTQVRALAQLRDE